MKFIHPSSFFISGLFAIISPCSAALVDSGWALQTGSNALLSEQAAGTVTASATNVDAGLFTLFDAIGTSHTLTNTGDMITFTGSIFINGTLFGVNSHPGAIRFGLYNVNGSADTAGWLGYFGLLDTTGTAGTHGGIFKRNATNTSNFYSGTGATKSIAFAGTEPALVAGTTYNLSMTLTKTGGGIQIDSGATNAADGTKIFLNSTYTDGAPTTLAFNRLGIYTSGSGLGAETVTLANMNVSFIAAIPEPPTYALIGAGSLAVTAWIRRRKKRKFSAGSAC